MVSYREIFTLMGLSYLLLAVDGGYSNWIPWSPCDQPCGEGTQVRRRFCTNPPPSALGLTCMEQNLGPMREEKSCHGKHCRKKCSYSFKQKFETPFQTKNLLNGGTLLASYLLYMNRAW